MKTDVAGTRSRLVGVACLVAMGIYAVLIRCLHLLNPDHYYILGRDSYFFHWQAERLLSGQSVSLTWHSGLTYPLAWAAMAISFVSHLSPADALTLAGKFLPPLIGVATVGIIYLAGSRMYSRRVGLWAAFGWTVMSLAVLAQGAGYLDRDGFSLLLLMTGVFVFYFARGWHVRVAGRDVGWGIGAVAVMAIEGFLFVEWMWLGVVLLLAVIVGTVVMEMLGDLYGGLLEAPTGQKNRKFSARLLYEQGVAAFKGSNWRSLALVIGPTVVVGAIYPGYPEVYRMAVYILKDAMSNSTKIQELAPMTAEDIFSYGFLTIPILVGLYVAVTRRSKADLLCLGWLIFLFVLGLVARRMFVYAAPAACVISGVGLASIFDLGRASKSPTVIHVMGDVIPAPSARFWRTCAAVLLLLALVASSLSVGYHLGESGLSNQWYAALTYLRENSGEDAAVISWWDNGYWILDVAGRRPVVDNGLYWWDEVRLEDIGVAYCTPEAMEAVEVMEKYQADYLIFSRSEVAILPVITEYGLGERYGDGSSVPDELKGSLYYRSLWGDFQSDGGLSRIYPSAEIANPEVVILALHSEGR
jgi:asparagine N-glycosylation enzyme membrane subunit Stt3